MEPLSNTLELHLRFEVVPEAAEYLQHAQREPSLLKQARPLVAPFVAPEHPAVQPPEGLSRRPSATQQHSGYIDENYLDDHGGALVKEAFTAMFRDILGSHAVREAMSALRPAPRDPYFSELKPAKAPYLLLAEALGVSRKDQYQASPQAIAPRFREIGVPCKMRQLEELIDKLEAEAIKAANSKPQQQPQSPQPQQQQAAAPPTGSNNGSNNNSSGNNHNNSGSSSSNNISSSNNHNNNAGPMKIDLRRLVARMPHQMRNAMEQSLAVWLSMERRRRRSSHTGGNLGGQEGLDGSRNLEASGVYLQPVMLQSQSRRMSTASNSQAYNMALDPLAEDALSSGEDIPVSTSTHAPPSCCLCWPRPCAEWPCMRLRPVIT
jgi:hypothetical protein